MALSIKVRQKKNNFKALKRRLLALQNQKVFYGYFSEQGNHSKWDMSYAELMAINEYGTEKIPPRPVFSITLRQVKSHTPAVIKGSFRRYFNKLDSKYDPKKLLSSVGQTMVISTKSNFGDTSLLVTNHPMTIEDKGFNSPLIWTGELKANMAYKTSLESKLRVV